MKKKHKFLKTFSFTSLALLMGIAGTMAFAPLGASPSVAKANELETTTEQGLITPKADDPVIYTTESGLEIKWGNALPSTFANQLTSGNLQGFPYFTTTASSTTYYWVLIGQSPDVSDITFKKGAMYSDTVANIQTYRPGVWGTYFFINQYETITPAGIALNNEIMADYMSDTIRVSSEIPSGCVLVLANNNVATGVYNTSYGTAGSYKPGFYTGNENIATTMEGYYTNGSFGLSTIKSNIQSIEITSYCHGIDGGYSWAWWTNKITRHVYPLAPNNKSSFYWLNYLNSEQIKLSTTQWLRGNNGTQSYSSGSCAVHYITTEGSQTSAFANNTTIGYRPAFCLKIT